jgi:hypothetical protein
MFASYPTRTIWSIATNLASAQPVPEIRIGLVAIGIVATPISPRSSTCPTISGYSLYARLMDVQADGGGDEPEGVNQTLYDAV